MGRDYLSLSTSAHLKTTQSIDQSCWKAEVFNHLLLLPADVFLLRLDSCVNSTTQLMEQGRNATPRASTQ